MRALTFAVLALFGLMGAVPGARGQNLGVPPPPQECGSIVIVKCEKPEPAAADRGKRDAARRIEARRADRATVELDRVIIEGDADRIDTPEQAISRALYRPLVTRGEHSFVIGESAQCTCMNICPPPPLPCCSCTDRVGSSLANAPGWKPTR